MNGKKQNILNIEKAGGLTYYLALGKFFILSTAAIN
jgi:hypothetical protein